MSVFRSTELSDYEIGFEIRSVDSCLKVILNKPHQKMIKREPFILQSGDILNVGDKFTGIDKCGSAGTPPIKLASPWYQQYEGKIRIPTYTNYGSWLKLGGNISAELALFSAHNPITGEKMFGPKKRTKDRNFYGVEDGWYMGYLIIHDKSLFYWNLGGASRIVKCKSISRYLPKILH